MLNRMIPITLILIFALAACGGDGDGQGGKNNSSDPVMAPSAEIILERFSDEEYNALTAEEKFAVFNCIGHL